MDKYILTLIISFATVQSHAQWIWSKTAGGGTGGDQARTITTDLFGNVYAAGYFQSDSIVFGATRLMNTDTVSNTADIFIAKFDGAGNLLWAKNAVGMSDDGIWAVCTDKFGNIYTAGWFRSPTIVFDNDTLHNTSSPSSEMFIVKYNSIGSVLWAKNGIGSENDWANSLSADANGNVYVAGWFDSPSINFDSMKLTNSGISSGDMFIVKYDMSGNLLWCKKNGGTKDDRITGLSTDNLNNIYVTGYFGSANISFGSTTLYNSGDENMFIAKYDSLGTILWSKSSTGNNLAEATTISNDMNGNSYVGGFFDGNSNAKISFDTFTLTGLFAADIFLTKYNSSGTVLWSKAFLGNSDEMINSVSADSNGNVYATGYFHSTILVIDKDSIKNASMFVAKCDSSGKVIWAEAFGKPGDERSCAVSADAFGNVYVDGYYWNDTITFGSNILVSGPGMKIFIAKLGIATGIVEEENTLNNINGVTIFPNPFSSLTTLQTKNSFKNTTLTVRNLQGQIVKKIDNLSGQTFILSRDNINNGLYFLQLTQEGKVIGTKKIMIIE